MVKLLRICFHSSVLLVFMSGLLWQIINWKDEIPKNKYIADILDYGERYFTMWNTSFQFIYFSMALIEDTQEEKTDKTKWVVTLTRVKAFMFSTLIIPAAAFVMVAFWGFYYYDRELIFPEGSEYFIMNYSNHVVHTAIGVSVLLEFFFTSHHPRISFLNCFIVMTVVHVMYYTVFFYHYFTKHRYLYPVFDNLEWYQFGAVVGSGYLWTLVVSKIGIEVHKFLRKRRSKDASLKNQLPGIH